VAPKGRVLADPAWTLVHHVREADRVHAMIQPLDAAKKITRDQVANAAKGTGGAM